MLVLPSSSRYGSVSPAVTHKRPELRQFVNLTLTFLMIWRKKTLCHLSNFVLLYSEFLSFQIKILWVWQILISGYRFKLQQTLFVMSGVYSIPMCDRKAPLVSTLHSTPTSLVWALWWSPISFGDSVYEVLFEIRQLSVNMTCAWTRMTKQTVRRWVLELLSWLFNWSEEASLG